MSCLPVYQQILWKDNTTGGGMNTNSRPSSTSSVPARDGVPPEWDELAVDVKFSQSYVSLTLLRQEQETLSQELKRVPDTDKVSKYLRFTLCYPVPLLSNPNYF